MFCVSGGYRDDFVIGQWNKPHRSDQIYSIAIVWYVKPCA